MERELIKNIIRKPVTLRFPYEKEKPHDTMRARVSWNIEKCVGCSLCVKICPSNAIKLEGRKREAEIIYKIGFCIFCGECVDICPTKAIYTTKDFELVYTKKRELETEYRRINEKNKQINKKEKK